METHRDQVDRGSQFRQLTEEEREEIIRRARRMAVVGRGGLVEIARRIARKIGRSTETVRTTLKAYDRDHPDRALFPTTTGPLDADAKSEIYKLFRRGVSVEVLARQFGRTRSSVYRVVNEMRADKLRDAKLEYMHHPTFDDPAAHDADPRAAARTARRQSPRAVPKHPRACRRIWRVSTKSRSSLASRRAHLFRKMNYLKYLADRHPQADRPDAGADRRPG